MTKQTNYRNPELLKWAKRAPRCFGCGRRNDGSIVAAHSNQLRDGKGKGLKAKDYRVAYLCFLCHTYVDQSKASRDEKRTFWEDAHRETIGWLFDEGILTVERCQ